MKLSDFIIENKNDSYYAYHDAAKKWSEDTGKPERDFGRAGVDVQDKYIEPEMKKRGLVPDSYMGAGATKYRRESIEDIPCPACGDTKCEHKEEHMEEGTRCWKGYEKKGMKTMFGKRVPNCVKKEGLEEGMIGEPDDYYDAEERTEAYNDLQDALQGNYMDDYIKDGACPACGGNGYMDGEETFTNDDGEEEESSECDGFGNYGCDEGEMTYGSDGPSWVEIKRHDERKAEKANRGPAPSKEQIMKLLPILHKDYVQTGRYNAFELGGILRQMYPELGKRQASSYVADFFSTFSESAIHEGNKGEGDVAKMLSKALGDENRWTEMSPYELYAELESQNPEVADMLAKVAMQLYDVKLKERAYKDVGVADVHKDARGKEFKFDKGSKKFKSLDGEEADPKTKLGKDLMRQRRNAMKKSSPSYNKKTAPKKPSLISQIFGK